MTPAVSPAACAIAPSSRTVVVLPLVPVTSATGMSRIAAHGMRPAMFAVSSTGHTREPTPSPTDTRLSSSNIVTPWRAASAARRVTHGLRSRSSAVRSRRTTSTGISRFSGSAPRARASAAQRHASSLISVAV